MSRLLDIWRSLRSLPGWVQIWVLAILVPVNVVPFFFLDTSTGVAASLAAVFVAITNMPLMWICRGMNKAMSIPHLFAWIPLNIYLALCLADNAYREAMMPAELVMVVSLLVANTISLAFDVVDSWKWIKGDRVTPGLENT
ncbi:MAG: hypothetical protein KDH99_08370 [Alcanivoracaceae bacterium]|nr:hypothetical protein [Alcanivoracaceae bacterium]